MRRYLAALAFAALAILAGETHARPAAAACAVPPYIFIPGISVLTSSSTNGNNTTLYQCATNVDFSQVGSAGFYASQIKPTTAAQATFGGTQVYTIPGIISSGPNTLSGTTNVQGPVSFQGSTSFTSPISVASGGLGSYVFAPSAVDVFEGDSNASGFGSSSCASGGSVQGAGTGTCAEDQVARADGARELILGVPGTCTELTTISGSSCNQPSTTTGSLIARYRSDVALTPQNAHVWIISDANDGKAASTQGDTQISAATTAANLTTIAAAFVANSDTVTFALIPQNNNAQFDRYGIQESLDFAMARVAAQAGYTTSLTNAAYSICKADTGISCLTGDGIHGNDSGQGYLATLLRQASYHNTVSSLDAQAATLRAINNPTALYGTAGQYTGQVIQYGTGYTSGGTATIFTSGTTGVGSINATTLGVYASGPNNAGGGARLALDDQGQLSVGGAIVQGVRGTNVAGNGYAIANATGTNSQTNIFTNTAGNQVSGIFPEIFGLYNGSGGVSLLAQDRNGNFGIAGNLTEKLTTPADNAFCIQGTFYLDPNFIYVCAANGTVKRAALSSF